MDENQIISDKDTEVTNPSMQATEVAGAWANPNTHAYISRTAIREENLFLEEYYSSTDTKIYFDDAEQTEIGYIQYSIQEQLKPLYGYSSRTWDDVAIGNRIVTGIIKIPIRNVDVKGYGENLKNPSAIEFLSYNSTNKSFEFEEHNDNEENNLSNIEWIGSSTPGGSIQNTTVSQPTNDHPSTDNQGIIIQKNMEYVFYSEKLKELGYDLDTTLPFTEAFKNQIGEFQNYLRESDSSVAVSINSYRQLTDETKRNIDEACKNLWKDNSTIIVPKNSRLCYYPTIGSDFIYLDDYEEFIVIVDYDVDIDGHQWKKIISKNPGNNYCGFYCKELCGPE